MLEGQVKGWPRATRRLRLLMEPGLMGHSGQEMARPWGQLMEPGLMGYPGQEMARSWG